MDSQKKTVLNNYKDKNTYHVENWPPAECTENTGLYTNIKEGVDMSLLSWIRKMDNAL